MVSAKYLVALTPLTRVPDFFSKILLVIEVLVN